MVDEKQVSEIVKNVIAGMDISSFDNKPARKQLGVFDTMEEAIAACNKAYTTFRHYNKEQRENIIKEIRRLTHEEAEPMAKLAVEDTKMGNVYHKILKHHLVADKTLGTSDLEPVHYPVTEVLHLLRWLRSELSVQSHRQQTQAVQLFVTVSVCLQAVTVLYSIRTRTQREFQHMLLTLSTELFLRQAVRKISYVQ